MKNFELFGFVIEIRKKSEVSAVQEKVAEISSTTEQKVLSKKLFDTTDVNDQLYQDALKCSRCMPKTCLCPKAANYILKVGVDVFRRQVEHDCLPKEMKEWFRKMDLATIMAFETCREFSRILKEAGH